MKRSVLALVVVLVLAGFESVAVHAVEPVVQDYAGSKAKKAFLQRLLGGDPAAIKTFMKIVLGASLVGGGSYVAYRVLTSGTKPKKPAAASRQLVVPGKPAAGPKPNSRPRRTRRLPVAAPVAPTPTPVLIPVEPEPVVYRAPSPIAAHVSNSPVEEMRRPIVELSPSPIDLGSDGTLVVVDEAISRTPLPAMFQPEEVWEGDPQVGSSPVGSVPDGEPDVVQSRISSPIASLHSEASRREEAPFEFEETDNPDELPVRVAGDLARSSIPDGTDVVGDVPADRSVRVGAGSDPEKEKAKDSVDCSICLSVLGDGSEVTALQCPLKQKGRPDSFFSHAFHSDCLKLWLKKSTTCPICLATVNPNPSIITPSKNEENSESLQPVAMRGAVSGLLPAVSCHEPAPPLVDLNELACRLAQNRPPVRLSWDQFRECLALTGRDGRPSMELRYYHDVYDGFSGRFKPAQAPFIRGILNDHPGGFLFVCRCVIDSIDARVMRFGYLYCWKVGDSWILRPDPTLTIGFIESVSLDRVFGPDDLSSPSFQRLLEKADPWLW